MAKTMEEVLERFRTIEFHDDFDMIVAIANGGWKSHTNLTHPGKYFRPSKVKIMRPTSPK